MCTELKKVMKNTFTNVQFNKTCHKKYITSLRKISKKYNLDELFEEFIACLKVALSYNQRDSTIENTLEFAAKFAVSLQPPSDNASELICPFLQRLFDFLLNHHNAQDKSIRFRICNFINTLLNVMGEHAFLDDMLCDRIILTMTERLLDISPQVRAQAIFALHRLQDPSDENCPVIKAFIFHLSKDPNINVRKAVLKCMAKTPQTLHAALRRIRDVNDTVRQMAYGFISKITVKSLTIKQRIQLLNEGLKDRADSVREYVENVFLPGWLHYFKGIYLDLLRALDAEIGTEISILALNILFKKTEMEKLIGQIPIDKHTKVIPVNELTSENSLYWRCLAQYCNVISHTEALDTILPELSSFTIYIKEFITMIPSTQDDILKNHMHTFILLQLFEITKIYDLSDEAGRQRLSELILNVLTTDHCSKEIIDCVVNHLENVIPDVNKRIDALTKVISNIRIPVQIVTQVIREISPEVEHENNMQKAKLQVKLLELQEEEYEAVKHKEYSKATKLTEEMKAIKAEMAKFSEHLESNNTIIDDTKEEKSDSLTMIKCLSIICAMSKAKSVRAAMPTLKDLMQITLSALDHQDNRVHVLALEALAIFCILDKESAKIHIWTFLLELSNEPEHNDIWVVTLKAIFDLLLFYGLEFFDIPTNVNDNDMVNRSKESVETTNSYNQMEKECSGSINEMNIQPQSRTLITILMGLLDYEDPDLRTIATEGFCKLLLNRRIYSSTLLTQIIIMYYNPVNSGNNYLCQCVSAFFKQFVLTVPNNQEMLEETFFPVLHILCNVPETSPLLEVDPYNVALFILSLTRNGQKSKADTFYVHNNLVFKILTDILNPDSNIDKGVLIKSLNNLDIHINDKGALTDLNDAIDKVMTMVNKNHKRLVKFIDKFKQKLNSLGDTETMEQSENDTDTEE